MPQGLLNCVPEAQGRLQMRWFRSHRLKVASLALFALTCQFRPLLRPRPSRPFCRQSRQLGGAAAAGKAVAAAPGKVTLADLPTSPRQKNPSGLGDDFCAVCASISLAGAWSFDCANAPARDFIL